MYGKSKGVVALGSTAVEHDAVLKPLVLNCIVYQHSFTKNV